MIPAPGVSAPADLAARFAAVLADSHGRRVSADALFDTLKLEALDWGLDHEVDTPVLDAEPAAVDDGKEEA